MMNDTFRCGHPRTPENSWSAGIGHRRCKQCRQRRKRGEHVPRVFVGDGVTTFKACGHPRTEENSWSSGRYPRCKTCHAPRIQRWRTQGPLKPRAAARITAAPDLSNDPAVALYKREKERRVAAASTPVISLAEHRPGGRSIPRYWGRAS
jgi:hypothetical protein